MSPLHHRLWGTDGNPAPQWPKPGTRGSGVNSEVGEGEPGRIKGALHKHSTTRPAPTAVVFLQHVPAASSTHAALHPSTTEADDALAGFLPAFAPAACSTSGQLITSAKDQPDTSPGETQPAETSRESLQPTSGPTNAKSLTTEAHSPGTAVVAQPLRVAVISSNKQAFRDPSLSLTAELLLTAPRVNPDPFQ